MMKIRIQLLRMVVLVAVLAGCTAEPTQEDLRSLSAVQQEYSSLFDFDSRADLYLKVRQRAQGDLTEVQGVAIAQKFWGPPGKRRTDSSYVYMNFYSQNGYFLFQVHWDPSKQAFIISNTEYY
jgi:hypothetical protein